MSPQIRFTNYSFTDSETESHFAVDFTQGLDVKQRHLDLIINDLGSFQIDRKLLNKPIVSVLELNIEGSTIKVARNYGTDSITCDPPSDGGPLPLISEKLGKELTKEDFSKNMVVYSEDREEILQDLVKLLKTSSQLERIDMSPEAIKARLEEMAGPQGLEYFDMIKRVQSIDQRLQGQRKVEQLSAKLDELQKKIGSLEADMQAVQEIMAQKQSVATNLGSFPEQLKQDREAEVMGGSLKAEIKVLRDEQLREDAHSAPALSNSDKGARNSIGLVEIDDAWSYTPILSVGVFIAGISAALITGGLNYLLAGVVSAAVSYLIWFQISISPNRIIVKQAAGKAGERRDVGDSPVMQTKQNKIKNMERFFVDRAWVRALVHELDVLQAQIKSRLGGKDYEEMRQLHGKMKQEAEEFSQQIRALKENELTPEEFLKLRRELDLARIDKTRVENSLKQNPEFLDIEDMVEQLLLPDSEQQEGGIKTRVIPGYDQVRVSSGNQIEMHHMELDKWEARQLTRNELYGLILYVKFLDWEKDPITPLILVNLQRNLEGGIKDFANARMNELADLGQVVVVNMAL